MNFSDRILQSAGALTALREKSPLVHCITSPIAVNDCANAVLAAGARPIMAEHPEEVEEITSISASLGVSLANITDARRESIFLSGRAAKERGIPSVIDAVGVTCSRMRLDLARRFLTECRPAVIKGNASEIRALSGASFGVCGIDTAEQDRVSEGIPDSERAMAEIVRDFAAQSGAVVLASGASDLVSNGTETFALRNGSAHMGRITGTGCILNCLVAAYLAAASPLDACLAAVTLLNLSGEYAERETVREAEAMRKMEAGALVTGKAPDGRGTAGEAGAGRGAAPAAPIRRLPLGTFHIKLWDGLSLLTEADLIHGIRGEKICL